VTLRRGFDLPATTRRAGSVPVISSSGITGYHDEAKVNGPGVVTGRYGTLGQVFFVNEPFWPLNTTLYVQDFKGNDPRFVSYFLRGMGFSTRSVAAAVPGVNRNDLHRLTVARPPLSTQRRIASILSAYDDLIENNTRRIQILEAMAQAIYREWFVEFRFPGHEDVRMVDSALGLIPEGWRWSELREHAREVRAGIEPAGVPPETPYFGLEHLPERSIAIRDWGQASDATSRKYRFDPGDILFGKIRPYFHKVGIPPVQGICSTDAIVIRSFREAVAGLVLAVVSSQPFVQQAVQTSQGTKMPRANWNVLERYPVPVPADLGALAEFNTYILDSVRLIHVLVMVNRNLAATRDLLLPRLISGEIDVSEVDLGGAEPAA